MTNPPPLKAARITGVLFLLSLIVPTLNWVLVYSKVSGNGLLFRIGIVNDLMTATIGIALALALYMLLESVNKNLAALALFLKLTEAILVAVIALGGFAASLFLDGKAVGLFVKLHMPLSAIPMVFLGLNLMVFLYLLFESKYVPRALAAFGVVSYLLIFIYALLTIVSPSSAVVVQVICWAPSCFFELIIGVWLLVSRRVLR